MEGEARWQAGGLRRRSRSCCSSSKGSRAAGPCRVSLWSRGKKMKSLQGGLERNERGEGRAG